ncbi:ProQ/FINO family protein [Vibrio hepatarius]|uniref:ProQ/FINO family protein n=1 Tax=Vibrio hepatarius TaxID=171383 RepID=UPI001C0999BC|nr:ProQ/FINO family protein [Vibrio hepatarius]MBU2898279.1 hypothetical protein [Vibrio hepatarius]
MYNDVKKNKTEAPRHHQRSQGENGDKKRSSNFKRNGKPSGNRRPSGKKPAKKMSKTKIKTLKSFLLCKKFWPRVFNIYNPKPLCNGMRQVLLDDAEERGIKVSNSTAYNALFWMTSTIQYKQALVRYHSRFDQNGEIVGVVSDDEKAKAQEYIDNAPINAKKVAEKTLNKSKRPQGNHRGNNCPYQGQRRQVENQRRQPTIGYRGKGGQNRQSSQSRDGETSRPAPRFNNRDEKQSVARTQRAPKVTYRSSSPRSSASSQATSTSNS